MNMVIMINYIKRKQINMFFFVWQKKKWNVRQNDARELKTSEIIETTKNDNMAPM